MASTRVVTTCLLGLVLASSFVSTVQSLRPAPEGGFNGKSELNLTQSGETALLEILQHYGSSMAFERTPLTEVPMGFFQYLFKPAVHATAVAEQGGSNIGLGRHLNEFGFQVPGIPLTSDDSTAKDISSAGHHQPAGDLLPIVQSILGVFIVAAVLAICAIKRRRNDNSNSGAAVARRPSVLRETADQHWGRMQARAEYEVIGHKPTYVTAPAAGEITRIWECARADTAVVGRQPLFMLKIDGANPRIISTPAPGRIRDVSVVDIGVRVAEGSWLAALDIYLPSLHGTEAVADSGERAHPEVPSGAHPPRPDQPVVNPAHPAVHPGAYPAEPDQSVVDPAQPAHSEAHSGADTAKPERLVDNPAKPTYRMVHPKDWISYISKFPK